MIYGYYRAKTLSHKLECERSLSQADELYFDIQNEGDRGHNETLFTVLDKLQEGDTLLVINLSNAFVDIETFSRVTEVVNQLGVVLRTSDMDFSTNPSSHKEVLKSIETLNRFYLEKQEELFKYTSGSRKATYPRDFLHIVDLYESGEIRSREAGMRCGASANTFMRLYREWSS